MKKVAIVLITMMVISVGFLSGCSEEQGVKTSNSIIGQWVFGETVMGFYENGIGFVGNGSFQFDMEYTIRDDVLTLIGKFDLSVGWFVLIGTEFKTSKIYRFEFIDEDTLKIIEINGDSVIWTRI